MDIGEIVSWVQAGLWVIAAVLYIGRRMTGKAAWPKSVPDWVKRVSSSNRVIGFVIVVGLMVSGISIFMLAAKPRIVVMKPFLQSYGMAGPGNLFVAVDTGQLVDRRKSTHLMMMFRIADYTLDPKYDATIEKSNMFDISGSVLPIEHPLCEPFKIRLMRSHGGILEFYLIILPKDVQAEKVTLLSDVELLNGQILEIQSFSLGASVIVPVKPKAGTTAQPVEQ